MALEAGLPHGARARQLSARTLLVGMLVALAEGRPAQLTRAHAALLGLPEADRPASGWWWTGGAGPHCLTYRQVEHTARALVTLCWPRPAPMASRRPPWPAFRPPCWRPACPAGLSPLSACLAVDWTDVESFACPPVPEVRPSADPEASWGHRRGHAPGQKDELFFGYYLSAATMVNDEAGPAVPELVRRATLSSCRLDPVPAFVPALADMAASGVALGDVLADSGYAHRVAEHWALPLRALGAEIVTDLHPADRGPRGTFAGAICCNGNLYCPAAPPALFGLGAAGPGRQCPRNCRP